MSILLRRGLISSGKGGALDVSAANTDGSTQEFNGGNPASLQITGAITVSCWVKFDNTTNEYDIARKYESAGDQRSWRIQRQASNKYRVLITHNGTSTLSQLISSGSSSTSAYQHIVFTYDGTTGAGGMKLYINGSEDNTATASNAGLHNSTDDLRLFQHLGEGAFVSIWDNDISAAQVTELYNVGVPECYDDLGAGLLTDMVSFWDLANWTGSTGTEIEDKNGSNDVTNVNSIPFTGTGLTVSCT